MRTLNFTVIRTLPQYLLLVIAYVISGKLGLMLALPPGYTSPIFPPAGIAVAAALIGGRKTLPWIFLGSLLLNVWIGYSSSLQISMMGLMVAAIIAIASMLQAALGGWGLQRVIGYPASLDHNNEVMRFLLLAPVICLTSASLSVSGLLSLGIIDAASFATNWAAWWVGDTLGVMVMLPLVLIVAGEPRALWQSRRRTVAVPMLLAFTLFVMIFLKANQWENDDSLTAFRQISQQAVNQAQNKLGEQEAVLEEMAALFIHDVDDHVSREEFHRFVEKSLHRFPMIQALEWASPVDKAHRASFEAVQRKDAQGFEIREQNAAGQMQRASERASFYPVTYIEPLTGNEPALGFDLASNPERRAALTEALQCGIAVTTPSVKLVQEHQQQAGVLLLLAVNLRNKESGTVLTVLRMGDFMDNLLLDTRPMLYTRLIDMDEQKTIYDNFEAENQHALYARTFDFGTRHYRLETAPTPAYLMQHHGWQSWSVLAAGILGTGLLGALFLLGTGYTARIEEQVEDRTRKLRASELKFLQLFVQVPIPLAVVGNDGTIIHYNDRITKVFGYTIEDTPTLKEWWQRVYPDEAYRQVVMESWGAAVTKAARDGSDIQPAEYKMTCKNGLVRNVMIGGAILEESILATFLDITDSKQAEEALRKSREGLEDAQRIGQIGSWDWDAATDTVTCSRECYRILGLDPAKPLPSYEGHLKLYTPESAARLDAAVKQSVQNGEPYALDLELKSTDGLRRWVTAHSKIKRDASGKFVGLSGTTQDVTERKAKEEQIRNLAFYDALTQLPNRRLLNDRLGQTMAASKRSGRYGALMFLDLDNFKPLNDTHGHGVGDLLLIEVARRIGYCVRETDTVARFGGDEFVVMLSELDEDKTASTAQADLVAEKIRATLAEPYLLTIRQEGKAENTVEYHCTSSIGMVLFINHEASQEDLIKWADMAMYQAKEAGRDSIRLYS